MLWIRPLSKCPFVSGHRYIWSRPLKKCPCISGHRYINEASSTFYLKKVKVSPDSGVVDITGELHFFYGIKAVEPVNKHYRLRLETRDGALKLTDFVELPV